MPGLTFGSKESSVPLALEHDQDFDCAIMYNNLGNIFGQILNSSQIWSCDYGQKTKARKYSRNHPLHCQSVAEKIQKASSCRYTLFQTLIFCPKTQLKFDFNFQFHEEYFFQIYENYNFFVHWRKDSLIWGPQPQKFQISINCFHLWDVEVARKRAAEITNNGEKVKQMMIFYY